MDFSYRIRAGHGILTNCRIDEKMLIECGQDPQRRIFGILIPPGADLDSLKSGLLRQRRDYGSQVQVLVGNMHCQYPVGLKMPQVYLECLFRQQVDRNRVAVEGIYRE